jgi:5-methylcytosine-specific restriction endonuclease McrA
MTLEHLTPLSQGGSWDMANLATACFTCNNTRGIQANQHGYQRARARRRTLAFHMHFAR